MLVSGGALRISMSKMDLLYKRISTSALALNAPAYAEERRCERLFTHQQTRTGVFLLGPTQDERRGASMSRMEGGYS